MHRTLRLFRLFLTEQSAPDLFYRELAADSVRQVEAYGSLAGRTALDLGGGPGHFTAALRARGARCVLVEPDLAELSALGTSPAGAVRGDGMRLPVADAAVDVCFSSNVLEHVQDPDRMVAEMIRVTRPGGLIYLAFTNWYSPWGGHEMSPWHYLGAGYAERRYLRKQLELPKNRPGTGLFPLHVGPILRQIRGRNDVEVLAAQPRYYPRWCRAVLAVPGLREVLTWNLMLVLRRLPDAASPAVRLTGWGRTEPTVARVSEPADQGQLAVVLKEAPARGIIARGLGRSYNNAAQNDGGQVVLTTRLNRITGFDQNLGIAVCESGVSLEQLIIRALPTGWFIPVSPGTRQVTIGGAIAADVHGKNHHVAGSFARHVPWFDLLLPDGQERRVTPAGDPRLFWATAGGMGLTGIILRAAVQLTKVATSRVRVDTVRTADIDEALAYLAETDASYTYSVAWLDCLAGGRHLGRSVITSGDFAEPGDLTAADRRNPLEFRPAARLSAPPACPPGLINRHSVALANEAWYRKAPRRREGEIQTIGAFFHPLDGIRNWNRVYGPAGFRQYQFVVPFGAEATVSASLERISHARAPSFVTVLKRFGPGDEGFLSFPMAGWTLALDFPARTPGLARLLTALDDDVLAAGGRVYLAKDSRIAAGTLAGMYPRLSEFRDLRAELDPGGVMASDLSRRLEL